MEVCVEGCAFMPQCWPMQQSRGRSYPISRPSATKGAHKETSNVEPHVKLAMKGLA